MKNRVLLAILVTNISYILLISSIAFYPVSFIHIAFGLPALLIFPGYVCLLALLPDRTKLSIYERAVLSLGLSIALVPLIGMILNYTPLGITTYSVLFSLWFLVLALGFTALYRQRKLPAEPASHSSGASPASANLRGKLLSFTGRTISSEAAKLCLILALGYGLTFIPHLNYIYPIHVDEWMHLAYSRAIQEAGSISVSTVPIYEFPNFTTGQLVMRPGDVEPGFHLLWAVLQQVTGISWLIIFRYFPGVIFMLTISSVYVLAKRKGYGLEAAFFAALITTNTTMLGVSLLVPIALGLIFLPLSLLLIFYHRTVYSYILLGIFTSFLAFMHLPTAVICTMICLVYAALRARQEWKHSMAVAIATLVPLLGISPLIAQIAPEFAKSFTQLIYLPEYLPYLPSPLYLWGYLPSIFFVIGVVYLARKGGTQDYALVIACLLLLLHNMVFFYFHRGVQILYHRSPHYLMLMMSIIGGHALWRLRVCTIWGNLIARFKERSFRLNWLRYALLGIVVALILAETVSYHWQTPFYHMIDEADYNAFVWIEENLPQDYQKAILDPWKATAFMALARREVYARIQHAPKEDDTIAYDFLNNGCTDTEFLKDNGISIVYTTGAVNNSDLVPLRKNIYVLP